MDGRMSTEVERGVLNSQLWKDVRKFWNVATLPSDRWRLTLLRHRRLSTKSRLYTPNPGLEDRDLCALIETARRHPEALQLAVRKLWRAAELERGLLLVKEVWDSKGAHRYEAAIACAATWFQYGLISEGDAAVAMAIQLDANDHRAFALDAAEQLKRGNVNGAISSAEEAFRCPSTDAKSNQWRFFAAEQSFRLDRYKSVVQYLQGVDRQNLPWKRHYEFALSLEALGHEDEARAELVICARKTVPYAKRGFEIAELHFKADRHRAMLDSLKSAPEAWERDRLTARAQLALGHFDECAALCLGPRRTPLLAEYGALALELSGRKQEALVAYADLLKSSLGTKRKKQIFERYSRVAFALGHHTDSVNAAMLVHAGNTLDFRSLDAEVNPRFAKLSDEAESALLRADWKAALYWLRKMELNASTWANFEKINRSIGVVASGLSDKQVAATAFARCTPFPLPNVGEANAKTVPLRGVERYCEFLETTEIDGDEILYESFYGAKTACNPLAICLELLQNSSFAHLQHVWVVRDGTPIHPELLNRPNVHFVRYQSAGYMLRLSTAKYVVTNSTFPRWFVRRPGQRYVNTWHGVPWKKLGRDVADDSFAYENVARNLLQVTDLLMPNVFTAETLVATQDVARILPRPARVIGSPRVDRTLNMKLPEKLGLRARLGLSGSRPIVFYAPTWRGKMGSRKGSDSAVYDAVMVMAQQDVEVILRSHYFADDPVNRKPFPPNVHVPDESFDSNELLGLSDVLVSDYSSIIFDFAPLDRPIIKHLYDLEEYTSERGLYFEPQDIPGLVSRTTGELCEALSSVLQDRNSGVGGAGIATRHLWEREDGSASSRAIEIIFGELSPLPDTKNQLLVSMNSLNPNGVTRSFINLLAAIESSFDHVQTLLPASYFSNPDRAPSGKELRHLTDFTLRSRPIAGTRQERFVWGKLAPLLEPFPHGLRRWLVSRMRTEFVRLFGESRFDAVVDFDGHDLYAAALMAYGPGDEAVRVYVGHSEFVAEMDMRFPNHRGIGSVLEGFSRIASVSSDVMRANSDGMAERFMISSDVHTVLHNALNIDEIRTSARLDLDDDLAEWFARSGHHLIMLGRLSPEKNHELAFVALKKAREQGAEVDIAVLGDGPMRETLKSLVRQLEISEAVFFAGQRANPYNSLERADGLLLTSTHEGQPMVFLEAMVLQTPIVSGRIPAAVSTLDGGRLGLIVDLDVDGIAGGLQSVAASLVRSAEFAAEEYLEAAVRAFIELVSKRPHPGLTLDSGDCAVNPL